MKSKFLKIMASVFCALIIGMALGYHFITYTPHGRMDFSYAIVVRIVNYFGSEKKTSDYSPDEFRKRMDGIILRGQKKIEQVNKVEDKEIAWSVGTIPIRIYKHSDNSRLPVIIYFHGGGWASGSIATHDSLCRKLAKVSNTIVLSVGYGLAPEVKFPTPLEQGYAVLQWIVGNAIDLDIDINKIILAGDSAGATIATALCMMSRDRNGPVIRYQILLYPVTDLSSFSTPSHRNFGKGYLLTTESLEWLRGLYLSSDAEKTNPLVSPLLAKNLNNLPPAFIVTAQFDPLNSDGKAYYEMLKAAGNDCRYVNMPGVLHGFMQTESSRAGDVLSMIAQICRSL
jgi:acetyl esterase